MSRWSDRQLLAAVIVVIGVVAIAATTWIYGAGLTSGHEGPIRSDGVGYYAYLPALFLDHDLTMVRTAERSFGGPPTDIQGVNQVTSKSGKPAWLDQYGIGEATMMAPFFLVGHLLAMATGEPRTGFSWPYQAAANAAGLCYMLLGLMITGLVLLRWFSRRTTLLTVTAIAFGAAVLQYGTFDATFSHAYSFCLIAVVMWLAIRVWEHPSAAGATALGGTIGLVGLVRLTNLTALLIPMLIGIERPQDLRVRVRTLMRRLDLVALGCGVFIVVLLPQLAYWSYITGSAFISPYPSDEVVAPLHPHLVGVLFSVRKGLFFWTPLLLLATVGLPLLRRTARPLFVAAIAYLAVATYVVSSWSVWWYGGSFGMRALIDEMSVFALGLAALIETARSTVARRIVLVAVAVTSLLAVHGMISYWQGTIPYDGTTLHVYFESFLHI